MANHCNGEDCQEVDKFGYCACMCASCRERKTIEGEWAENEWKSRREDMIE